MRATRAFSIALLTVLFVAFPVVLRGQEATPAEEDSTYDGYLSEEEVEGLLLALDEHYRSFAMYTAVVEDLGPVSPFTLVLRGEQRSIDALIYLFDRFELAVPENTWMGSFEPFTSLEQACRMAADEELGAAEMYGELRWTTRRNVLLEVYGRLQLASERHHFPMFDRCAGDAERPPQS